MNRTPRQDLTERLKNPAFRRAFGVEQAKLEIGDLLFKARKSANLTQKELSEMLQISQPYIAKLEAGEANPTVEVIGSILAMLNVRLATATKPLILESTVELLPLKKLTLV
jgi:transcriptional regulator with XRE-family HTH domain